MCIWSEQSVKKIPVQIGGLHTELDLYSSSGGGGAEDPGPEYLVAIS